MSTTSKARTPVSAKKPTLQPPAPASEPRPTSKARDSYRELLRRVSSIYQGEHSPFGLEPTLLGLTALEAHAEDSQVLYYLIEKGGHDELADHVLERFVWRMQLRAELAAEIIHRLMDEEPEPPASTMREVS